MVEKIARSAQRQTETKRDKPMTWLTNAQLQRPRLNGRNQGQSPQVGLGPIAETPPIQPGRCTSFTNNEDQQDIEGKLHLYQGSIQHPRDLDAMRSSERKGVSKNDS